MDWPTLRLIEQRQDANVALLRKWSEINSGTFNLAGLDAMANELFATFSPLSDHVEQIDLPSAESIDSQGKIVKAPLGKALRFVKRPDAKLRVLLSIHYDTVFGVEHSFQKTRLLDTGMLIGPGVVDAKGGIVVILSAIAALEASDVAKNIGWEVLLNPDEEIGSPGSAQILKDAASRNHVGLVFEPAMADGSLVGPRKGSGTFTAIVHGRSAHAGRDFDKGRSAIVALAELIRILGSKPSAGVIVNCGKIEGGGAINIVPDLAIGRFNVRADTRDDQDWFEQLLRTAKSQLERTDGISVDFHGQFNSPPKPLDPRSSKLMDQIVATGREIGLSLAYKPSGGTCDGNKLAAAGLPVVDSMGPVGGELHSDREYVHLSSLIERAKLTALLLLKLASDEIPPP